MKNKNIISTTLLATLAANSSPSTAESLVLEEVTVSAQKTTELIQDVPVAVNVVTGETFDQQVGLELTDINKMVPGLYVSSSKNNPDIALRGVGTVAGGATTARTNIFMDGSYVSLARMVTFTQFDTSRFEILRGPQGTLYGKASPTASILIQTKNPDLTKTEGFVRQTLGEHDLSNTQFGISQPIIENELGIRIAGVYDENNTSDFEYANVDEQQLSRTKAGRITVLWEPEGMFSSRLSHTYAEYDSNQSRWISEVAPGANPMLDLPTAGSSIFDRKDFSNIPRRFDTHVNQTILEVNADLDWAVITSQSYYGESVNTELLDNDGTPYDADTQFAKSNLTKLFNQEFRIASVGNDVWDWMMGVYYASNQSLTSVTNESLVFSLPNGGLIGLPSFPTNFSSITDIYLASSNEDWGVFTHNTFHLNDDWTLTVGARWNRERRSSSNGFDINLAISQDYGSGYQTVSSSPINTNVIPNDERWIAWTGTIKLAYSLSVDETVYLTLDRAGRIGGQTLDIADTTPEYFTNYDPESSDSIEIGYKSEHLDQRLRFNVAAYYQIYNDFQFFADSQPIDTDLNGSYDASFRVTQNAKKVVSKGIEAEASYVFSENLVGALNISYNDTKFKDFSDAVCTSGERTIIASDAVAYLQCDLTGQRVGSDAGNWGITASGNYSLPLESLGVEWYFDALYNFNSERVSPWTRTKAGSYGRIDLYTGLRDLDGSWDLKLWVKNALDKEAVQNWNYFDESVMRGAIQTGLTPNDTVIDPQQFGITATYNF